MLTQIFMTKYFRKLMNKKNRKLKPKNLIQLFLGVIPFIILTIAFSCEEDPSALGSNLLPDSDKVKIHYDTTISFNGYLNKKEDYVTVSQSHPRLGYQNDPYFGTIEARYATNFIPISLSITFENDTLFATVDSTILYIIIDSAYGDRDLSAGFKVYKLIKPMENDSLYSSNSPIEDFIDLSDPISLYSKYEGDTIIIKLNNNFGDFLIPPADSIYFYRAEDKFIEKYYGIAIIPDETNNIGELSSINLYHANSKLVLHYHRNDPDGIRVDTTEFSYLFYSFNGLSTNFTEILHNHEEGIIFDYLNNDSLETDDLMFVQGLGGMTSKLIFNNFRNYLGDSLYSILNAEMYIPVYEDENFDLLYPPERLYFTSIDTDSILYQIDDYINSNFFNGYYDEDMKRYSFDISMHLKGLLNGSHTDSILYIKQINSSLYPHRVILKPNDTKLKITYTKH